MQALDAEIVDGGGLPGGGDGDDFEAGVVGRGASGVWIVLGFVEGWLCRGGCRGGGGGVVAMVAVFGGGG